MQLQHGEKNESSAMRKWEMQMEDADGEREEQYSKTETKTERRKERRSVAHSARIYDTCKLEVHLRG